MNINYVNIQGDSIELEPIIQTRIEAALKDNYYKPDSTYNSSYHFVNKLRKITLFLSVVLLLTATVSLVRSKYSAMQPVSKELVVETAVTPIEDEPPVTADPIAETEAEETFVSDSVQVTPVANYEPAQATSTNFEVEAVDISNYFRPQALSENLFQVVVRECEAANVPVNAVLAVMKTETQTFSVSSINHNTNGTYDSGIMQINSSNILNFARRYNCPEFAQNPNDPVANITVGVRHFAEMYNSYYESYQDVTKSLLAAAGAYNRGASNQNRYKNIYEYNARVYAHYQNLCKGIDTNIDYAAEIPAIKHWLINNIQL